MLEEYVEDNYHARFDTRSYHRYREMHFTARLDLNCWQTDGRTNELTDEQMEIRTSISHPATSRYDKNDVKKNINEKQYAFYAKTETKSTST